MDGKNVVETLVNFALVWRTYSELFDNDLLEDRREYTVGELQTCYSLNSEEAEYLHSLIAAYFDVELQCDWDKVDAEKFKVYIQEAEHSCWDGWDDRERVVIELLLADMRRAFKWGI